MARMRRGPIPTWTAGVQSFGVRDAMFTPRGELLAQVEFGWGGMHSIGRLVSTCPASANAVGSGCTGSGGANLLAATCLPWIGGTFRADATGLAANGLALGVYGFGAASVPLAAIVPQGVAGCTLLAAPDVLDAHVPVAGAVGTQLAIPNVPALVGQTLFRQFVSLEIAAGAITALTSTNALAVTFGVF
jgi:hypothetical protein